MPRLYLFYLFGDKGVRNKNRNETRSWLLASSKKEKLVANGK